MADRAYFFGTFNPIHNGHIAIAKYVLEKEYADKVMFVVSPMSPFKKNLLLLNNAERLKMVKMAIEEFPEMEASDVEFHMPVPSFSYDTLLNLEKKYPNQSNIVLLGSDQLEGFEKWKNYRYILDNYLIMMYPRIGFQHPDLSAYPQIKLIDAPLLDVSSTQIRKLIAEHLPVSEFVDDKVEKWIIQNGYYL